MMLRFTGLKKVQLPFVMGVWSDFSGKSKEPLLKVDDRKMLEFNSDNFNDRLKAIKPRVAFTVPNTLSPVPHFTTPAQLYGNILRPTSLFYHKLCKSKIADGMVKVSIFLFFYFISLP
jgi:hypothetical protein